MHRHLLKVGLLSAAVALVALSDRTPAVRAVGFTAAAGGTGLVDRAAFLNPPADARPAIRWWWPGGDVEDQELVREIGVISAAGFGAAEIQSFAVGLPETSAARTYGTHGWFDHVGAALEEAQRLGLKIDLTAGSSWPTGSDNVTPPESLQQLIATGGFVTGPGTLDAPFPGPTEPVRYNLALQLLKLPNTFDAAKMTPIALFAVKLDDDQTPTGPPTASTLPNLPPLPPTTFLDAGSVVDLAPFVSAGGIHWTIPDGSWALFGFYSGPTGAQPFYGADPNGGLVVDHLNEAALTSHLDALAGTAQSRWGAPIGATLRSLFVDSLELRTELFWTDDFLAQFAARRGYRLEPFMPVLFVPFENDTYLRPVYPNAAPRFEMRDAGSRVRYDYDRTVSELMVERFFETVATWSAAHGIQARVQAHGAPVDLLNAYTRVGIPETEGLYAGGRPAFLKYAASAAHVSGAPLVSSEVFAQQGGDANPNRMLQEANAHFAAGVNHLVVHGFPYAYSPGFGARGWMPFQSPYLPSKDQIGTFGTWLNETSPFWRFMPAINAQLARTQLVLREGQAVANVALYSDRIGYPDDRTLNPDVNRQLERSGRNYDYVNADLLGQAAVAEGRLQVGPSASYSALVFDQIAQMPVDVSARVAQLVQLGVPVIFIGDLPHRQPGYLNQHQNDGIVRAFFEQMFGRTREALIAEAKVTAGSATFIAAAADLPATLANDLSITPDVILNDDKDDIQFTHRRTAAADYYFFTSSRTQAFDTRVSFGHDGSRTPYVFDLRTGGVDAAPVYSAHGTRTVVPIHLEPGGAVLIGFEPAGEPPVPHLEDTDVPFVTRGADGSILMGAQYAGVYSVTESGRTFNVKIGDLSLPPILVPVWDLATISSASPGDAPQFFPAIALSDLSTVSQLSGFTGSAIYAATVQIPPGYVASPVRVVLSLGQVHDAAEVKVNNQPVAALLGSPFAVDISKFLKVGDNRLEVAVTITGSPSGLIGPVSLVAMYQVPLSALPPVSPPSVPFSIAVTPPNLPNSTTEDVVAAITQAAQITDRVNFQWIWQTPPNAQNPSGGPVVSCAQITPWVVEARRQGLGVMLQFQTFVTQLVAPNTPPIVRVANPIVPFHEGTFGNADLVKAYLDEIGCLAALEPDYLVLGPEVNFVVTFDFAEFQRFVGVYRKAYDIAKTISPWTQVGLSWQYDGLRDSLPLDKWEYIPAAGPQDFIGVTSYFGYSDSRVREYPTVKSIPADYFSPLRARFGPHTPILFTELGYSSHYANGLASQAEFLRRLPALLEGVRPTGVVWPLLHDVNFFGGPINGLNESGLITVAGTLKPSWHAAAAMKADGRLANITPAVVAPSPMPFAISASPPAFPTVLSEDLNMAALSTAQTLSGHVGLQFDWKDRVTNQVWNCADIQKYTDHAKQLGLRFTLQFNTYAALPPTVPGQSARVISLNPLAPSDGSSDGPSIGDPRIRGVYMQQVTCLASLGADYLVLGPELNVLLAARPDEFIQFVSVYQSAYALAKAFFPSTHIGVSYQYEAMRGALAEGQPPWYIAAVGAQDYVGFASYFNYSDDSNSALPSVLSIPYDYYDPIRTFVGANTPVVFTNIGWSSYYANGAANQAFLLNRLPTLVQSVRPVNVIWALQYDVAGYYPWPVTALNYLGLGHNDGTPKMGWWQALRLRQTRLFTTAPPPRTQ